MDLPFGVTLERRSLPADVPDGYIALVIEIENTYELYPDVTTFASVTVPAPPHWGAAYDTWLYDNIISLTGVGNEEGDSWYDLTVLESSDPGIIPVGTTWDWGY